MVADIAGQGVDAANAVRGCASWDSCLRASVDHRLSAHITCRQLGQNLQGPALAENFGAETKLAAMKVVDGLESVVGDDLGSRHKSTAGGRQGLLHGEALAVVKVAVADQR